VSAENKKQPAVLRILLSYLVVSKVIYYFNFIVFALAQGGFLGMGRALLERLMAQDVVIILIIVLTFNTDKFVSLRVSKYNKVVNDIIVHVIDYALYMVVLIAHFMIMQRIGWWQGLGVLMFVTFTSGLYLAIVIVVEGKKYLKKREVVGYTPALSKEEKIAMLTVLLNNSVLTQEEYDSKKETLLNA